jgi:hypothetical protein
LLGVAVGAVALETLEASVDSAPARAHELDEESEIVDARMSLGEELAFEALQPPDRLVQKASYLGDVARDGEDLGSEAVANCDSDLCRDRRFEIGGGRGEGFDLVPRALERRLQQRRLGTTGSCFGDPLLRPFESECIHGREATLTAGWTPPSWTTSYPPG